MRRWSGCRALKRWGTSNSIGWLEELRSNATTANENKTALYERSRAILDDVAEADFSTYLNLWEHVGTELPKTKGRSKVWAAPKMRSAPSRPEMVWLAAVSVSRSLPLVGVVERA